MKKTSTRSLASRGDQSREGDPASAPKPTPAPVEDSPKTQTDTATRRQALQSLFVERALTTMLTGMIGEIRSDRDALTEPTRALTESNTRVRKTTLLKYRLLQHWPRRNTVKLVQPIASVELLSRTTTPVTITTVMCQLNAPSAGRSSLADLSYHVMHQLTAQRVKFMVIDELSFRRQVDVSSG